MKHNLFTLTTFLLLIILFSLSAEAAYYDSYGYGGSYSSPYTLERGAYYTGYPTNSRVTSDAFYYPRGSGSLYYTNNRDSSLDSFSQSQSRTTNTNANEQFVNSFFGAQANYGRNLIDNQDQATYSQTGVNYDTGSSQYKFGDCSTPSYQRTLNGNFRGKSNDFTITETICGGQQINLQKNYGATSNYATTALTSRKTLQDAFNSGLITQTTSTDRTTQNQDTLQLRNTVSYQKSTFGQGYALVFN